MGENTLCGKDSDRRVVVCAALRFSVQLLTIIEEPGATKVWVSDGVRCIVLNYRWVLWKGPEPMLRHRYHSMTNTRVVSKSPLLLAVRTRFIRRARSGTFISRRMT